MTQEQLELPLKRTRPALYIRLSEEQLKEVETLALERGEKIQDFVKSCIFNEGNKRPIMSKDSCKEVVAQLRKIGNNFNQITKQMNSGFRRNWYDSF